MCIRDRNGPEQSGQLREARGRGRHRCLRCFEGAPRRRAGATCPSRSRTGCALSAAVRRSASICTSRSVRPGGATGISNRIPPANPGPRPPRRRWSGRARRQPAGPPAPRTPGDRRVPCCRSVRVGRRGVVRARPARSGSHVASSRRAPGSWFAVEGCVRYRGVGCPRPVRSDPRVVASSRRTPGRPPGSPSALTSTAGLRSRRM